MSKSDKKGIVFPCMETKMVPREQVQANNYNPNHVPKDKMKLLAQSIQDNGFCFPIVTIWSEEDEKYIIVDGFHRYTICQPEWLDLDPIPIVVLKHDITKRMHATVQFNKARGVHELDGDANIVKALIEQGESEEDIGKHLGLDLETIHRYKSLTGIAELFRTTPWGNAWEMEDPENAGGLDEEER